MLRFSAKNIDPFAANAILRKPKLETLNSIRFIKPWYNDTSSCVRFSLLIKDKLFKKYQ